MIAAVSKAGGFGVLGAAGMEPEQLDEALQMLTIECAGKSFGIDLIIPEQYVGREEGGFSLEELKKHTPRDIAISLTSFGKTIMSPSRLRLLLFLQGQERVFPRNEANNWSISPSRIP